VHNIERCQVHGIHVVDYIMCSVAFIPLSLTCSNADFKFEEFSVDITRALVAMRDVSFHMISVYVFITRCMCFPVLLLQSALISSGGLHT